MTTKREQKIQEYAIEAYKSLEPFIDKLSCKLETGCEVAYFLSNLENRLAIKIGLQLNRINNKQKIPK